MPKTGTRFSENRIVGLVRELSRVPLPLTPKRPAFIIGCARSGTSVLKRVLGRQPGIAAFPGEANDWWHPNDYPWIEKGSTLPPLWVNPRSFTDGSLASWPKNHSARLKRMFRLYQLSQRQPALIIKSAMVNYMLPTLADLFPDAKFIHIVRDPRAVAFSYAIKEHKKMLRAESIFRQKDLGRSFDDMAVRMTEFWGDTIAEIDAAVERLGLRSRHAYFECDYEAFCADPKAVIRKILMFLGQAGDVADLGEPVSNMNHKFKDSVSMQLLQRMEATLAEMRPPSDYSDHTNTWDQHLKNYEW